MSCCRASILRSDGRSISLDYPRDDVAIVSTTEPTEAAHLGMLWYDTAASATAGLGVRTVLTITGNTTLDADDDVVLVDASGGAVTVTLPPAADRTGKQFDIKAIDVSGGAVTIDGDGSETIDGGTTAVINSQYEAITIVSDGSEWWVL